MQFILYGVIAAALIFIFLSLKKNVRTGSVFKETADIIKDIMKEPDDSEENQEDDNAE